MSFSYPLLLEPVAVPRPWGGGRLCKLFERPCVNTSEPIGESWDVSTWPTDPGNPELATVTMVTNGPHAGTPLDKITDVPVVVKILDAAEKLSVQSHPVTKDVHKDEMWYILHAEPDAYLYCGFADKNQDPKEFCDLIHSENAQEEKVLSMLQKADNLKPGDYFNVPTGTVHAVGPGCVAFEVSEKTQVTYRLFDYNRGRALHLDDGCEAVATKRPDLPLLDFDIKIGGAEKVDTITHFPTFAVVRAAGSFMRVESTDRMHLVTATMGKLKIVGPDPDWSVTVLHSFSALLPPGVSYDIDASQSGEVLFTALDI